MQAKFICHKDFSDRVPKNIFCKEKDFVPKNDETKFLNRHILYRKKFSLDRFAKAVLRITADDYFMLYINGNFVLQGPPPGYPQRYYYMEFDITDYVHQGENVFAVHSYYQGLCNRVWVSADGRQSFWCELVADGKLCLVSDERWRVRDHSGYSVWSVSGYETSFCERYDSAATETGFESMDYDDSDWEFASVFEHADYTLVKSPLQPLAVEFRFPVARRGDGQKVMVDFGREMVGTLEVVARGKRGDEVTLRYGEELDQSGAVRYRLRCNCVYEEKWLLSGGRDVFEPFDYKAFRYAEIVFPNGVNIEDIRFRVRHYPFEAKGAYPTGNARLNAVLELCENTVHYGVQECFVDCPTREKGQYLGDLCVSGRAYTAITRDTVPIKKALEDFCASSFICKGLMAVAPSSHMQEIADYSLLFPALVLWVYGMDGDLKFVERMAQILPDMLAYFTKYTDENGLLDGIDEKWNLVDWPENCRDGYSFELKKPVEKGFHNVLNAFWIGFLQAIERIYQLTGRKFDIDIKRTEDSFIETFYNDQTGLFCDSAAKDHSSYHANVLPLLFEIGCADRVLKNRLIDFICRKGLRSGSVYFAYFALAALVRCGEYDRAVALTTADDAWTAMLNEGASTTFEAWGKEDKWNTSLFHPWAVAPLIVFCNDVAPY